MRREVAATIKWNRPVIGQRYRSIRRAPWNGTSCSRAWWRTNEPTLRSERRRLFVISNRRAVANNCYLVAVARKVRCGVQPIIIGPAAEHAVGHLMAHLVPGGVILSRTVPTGALDGVGGLSRRLPHFTDATSALIQPVKNHDSQRQACKKAHLFTAAIRNVRASFSAACSFGPPGHATAFSRVLPTSLRTSLCVIGPRR